MGSFIHYCKYCNAKLNVDDAWMGKTMKCPACGKKINFPQADNEFESAAGSSDLSDVPSAPDLQLPDPPQTGSTTTGATAVRRIKLKRKAKKTMDDMPTAPDSEMPLPPGADTPQEKPQLKIAVNSKNWSAAEDTLSGESEEKPVPLRPTATLNTKNGSGEGGPENNFFHKSYFWGRLGCRSVYVLAAMILFAGVYFSWHLYCDYRESEALIPEKIALAAANKELIRREKELSNQFKNAVSLLQGSGNIGSDGILDGMSLSSDICRHPDPMPLGGLSRRDLSKAQYVLEQYKQSNTKIKEAFVKSFGSIPYKPDVAATAVSHGSNRIIVQAGELKQQFYTNENYKKSVLESLEVTMQNFKNKFSAGNTEQQRLLKQFEAAAGFVRKQLFPNDNNVTVVKTRSTRSVPGKAQGELEIAAGLIVQLADGWQLDLEIAEMERFLEKIPRLINVYNSKKTTLLRGMYKEQVSLWLKTLLLAFALLVLGDVLRALFDKADILRRMEGKNL